MQLTGQQIINRGIVKNFCEESIQQQGVDVRVDQIYKVNGGGIVPAIGKTVRAANSKLTWQDNKLTLMPGFYELTLVESCEIPNNISLHYKTRSSLVRCGAIIHSGQFDAGFKTDAMGCFLEVICPLTIEHGARVAQAICFESDVVTDLYNGQWQGDKQRQ